jgi:single-stranded DNA-specific DHH superfamily exonuclease
LLKTKLDILNFDTYNFAQSLSLYPEQVREFLRRKGAIAWGIVPNESKELAKETPASLKDRLVIQEREKTSEIQKLMDELEALKKEMAEAGITFEEITHIVATHAHGDHYGLAGRLKKLSNATIIPFSRVPIKWVLRCARLIRSISSRPVI